MSEIANGGALGKITIDEATYKLGFEKFVEMLQTGLRPISLDKLMAPTILLTAIEESISTGSNTRSPYTI